MYFKLKKITQFISKQKNGLVGRTGIILLGTLLGQGVAFVLLPIITRVYPVDSLGRASSTLAIFSMAVLVLCFQYDQAVVVVSDHELPYILLLGSSIAIGWVAFLAVMLGLLKAIWPDGAILLSFYGVNIYLLLLLLTYAPFLLLTQLHLRRNALVNVSVGRFIYYGLGTILQVLVGYLSNGAEHMFLVAQIAASLIATLYLTPYKSVFRWFSVHIYSPLTILVRMKDVARAYVKFPKYQMEAQFATAASIHLPVLFMRIAFSDTVAGWYFMAWRLLAAPSTLLAQAVGQVFYRDSAEMEREGLEQGRMLENIVTGLIKISLLPATALGIVAPVLIPFFMGESWAPVTPIVQILLIMFSVSFFTSPISTLPNVKGLQAGVFIYYNLLFLVRTVAMLASWFAGGSELMVVWAYTLTSVVVLLLFVRYIVHSFGGSVRVIFQRVVPTLLDVCAVLTLATVLLVLGQLNHPYGLTLIVVLIGILGWREIKHLVRSPLLGKA